MANAFIDNNILYLGGINIEDKEQTVDFLGRPYQDYMVKISDNRAIAPIINKTDGFSVGFLVCF